MSGRSNEQLSSIELRPICRQYINWNQGVSKDQLISAIDKIKSKMIAVATGGPKIEAVNKDITPQVFARLCSEDKKELMLYRISILLPAHFSENTFIRIFDFDPKELKKSSSMASMKILEENGSNIASVLNSILRTKENRKRLTLRCFKKL